MSNTEFSSFDAIRDAFDEKKILILSFDEYVQLNRTIYEHNRLREKTITNAIKNKSLWKLTHKLDYKGYTIFVY
ncbi:ORF-43 [Buzura suppressaria nucleopolyhedrovirus]|uniref:ORF-43 n=1 Tax=Buzura suppressaria nuclear polyhedrosis virus TaxID=74320 RepID=W5VS47_NPVBS|nr:ORF-43 [Buzura suppressaria nucleopolyhedrovirus]AHH82632.1 ORF-43 [Buzura suppressaria nucleopolyhedrovirus]AKN91015.1 ORF-45 [Buzura suppressaria nucleopolyhedrovirus]QYF10550.1 hypothetical protein [Buzura suppressaria nucleopolyhedrovirus]